MIVEEHFNSWPDLEHHALELIKKNKKDQDESGVCIDDFLFRGHGDASWKLEPTIIRATPDIKTLEDYYSKIRPIKSKLESFNNANWPDFNDAKFLSYCRTYDNFYMSLPNYDFLVYLRHHGLSSPLLDWTRSFYIAAYFACEGILKSEQSDRVAIYIYQEHAGNSKGTSSNNSQIKTFGPYVRTHKRHHIQQAEYTIALQYLPALFDTKTWHLADYESVTTQILNPDQDKLWKFTMPASEAQTVMEQLTQYNITAYSLFGTEDALVKTLGRELLS